LSEIVEPREDQAAGSLVGTLDLACAVERTNSESSGTISPRM